MKSVRYVVADSESEAILRIGDGFMFLLACQKFLARSKQVFPRGFERSSIYRVTLEAKRIDALPDSRP